MTRLSRIRICWFEARLFNLILKLACGALQIPSLVHYEYCDKLYVETTNKI